MAKKYEVAYKVNFSDDEVLGAVLVTGFAEISDKSMVDFIFHNKVQSEPNNSIFRNRKEALIKMKDYVTIVQRLLDEQIAKENEVEK